MYVNIFSLPECCDVSLETGTAAPGDNTDNISYRINNLKVGWDGGCLQAVVINYFNPCEYYNSCTSSYR